ncbi:transglutaminase-like domain-containing protein [Microbacterium sp. CFBP9034]|uniref:transglutaminase-like domain-containing protein n=1 Tax=Microbacterium sp. CFBP9034 TaxID=3096540 RepID=UPI002A69F97E|nr:transglutaminase-like domain-containing protein [Microbacterium sp. CFBP9034]MDY0910577.1 transglutaminase-like domain-containing protein [Microbacterium sp. CFBP9034]
MQRDVSSRIVLDITEPADLVFAIAVSSDYGPEEIFTASLDGAPVDTHSVLDAHGTRLHRMLSGVGRLEVMYTARIPGTGIAASATEADLLVYTRPSRYAESDALAPTAGAEFAGITDAAELLGAVSSWVGTRLRYVTGSSLPTDGATRTLLARQGVCRDYAHLCVALLRGLGIPARMAAVYAPGLYPMDFHAVAEAWIDGAWRAVDATTLAPRSSLVRIATGRDAADTAFLNVMSGRADLLEVTVTAIVDALPDDDIMELVSIT